MNNGTGSKTIFEVLETRSVRGRELAASIQNTVRPTADSAMPQAVVLFPEFTPHLKAHFDAVVRILDWLVPNYVKANLNEYELFFLLAAAYLHDIGMVEHFPESPNGAQFETFIDHFNGRTGIPDRRAAIAEYVRVHHHVRAEEYISQNGLKLGLGSNQQHWEIVGRLAAGHRVENLRDRSRFGPVYIESGIPIHRDLLSGYLRLADELDISSDRTPLLAFEAVQPTGLALQHWRSHLSLGGVGPDLDRHRIVASGVCRDYDVHLFLSRIEEKIQDTLDNVLECIADPYKLRTSTIIEQAIPFSRVQFEVEEKGYKAWNIRFQLDANSITKILTSPLLYRDRTAAVRELIQNAVDTCRLRRSLEPQASSYRPQIVIRAYHDSTHPVLEVEDNGFGMNERSVRNYLSQSGRSFYTSNEFNDIGTNIQPLGRFGIGMLSTFMLAESLAIDTKREGSEALLVQIPDPGSLFKVTPSNRTKVGTCVRLFLKHDISSQIAKIAERYAQGVDIPISVEDGNAQTFIKPNAELEFDWIDWYLDAHQLAGNQYYSDKIPDREFLDKYYMGFPISRQTEDLRFKLTLVVPKRSGFFAGQVHEYAAQQVKVTNQGVLVTQQSVAFSTSRIGRPLDDDTVRILDWMRHIGIWIFGYVDLLHHAPSLTFSRDSFIDDPSSVSMNTWLMKAIIEEIGQLAADVEEDIEMSVLAKRLYLYELLVQGNGSFSISSYLYPGRPDDGKIYDMKNAFIFSEDRQLTQLFAAVFGTWCPVAIKRGADVEFSTLLEIMKSLNNCKIECSFADPIHPLSYDDAAVWSGSTLTIMLASPREYDLIKTYLKLANMDSTITFMTGWDLLRRNGAVLSGDVELRIGHKSLQLPVLDYAALNPNIALWFADTREAIDFSLAHIPYRSRFFDGGFRSPKYKQDQELDPVFLLNSQHPFVAWLQTDMTDGHMAHDFLSRLLWAYIHGVSMFGTFASGEETLGDDQLFFLRDDPSGSENERLRLVKQSRNELALEFEMLMPGNPALDSLAHAIRTLTYPTKFKDTFVLGMHDSRVDQAYTAERSTISELSRDHHFKWWQQVVPASDDSRSLGPK